MWCEGSKKKEVKFKKLETEKKKLIICHYSHMVIMDFKNPKDPSRQLWERKSTLLDTDYYTNVFEDIHQWLGEIFLLGVFTEAKGRDTSRNVGIPSPICHTCKPYPTPKMTSPLPHRWSTTSVFPGLYSLTSPSLRQGAAGYPGKNLVLYSTCLCRAVNQGPAELGWS